MRPCCRLPDEGLRPRLIAPRAQGPRRLRSSAGSLAARRDSRAPRKASSSPRLCEAARRGFGQFSDRAGITDKISLFCAGVARKPIVGWSRAADFMAPNALSDSAALVRRQDPDRFLTSLFAPAERREDLLALYAFNIEVAKTREVVTRARHRPDQAAMVARGDRKHLCGNALAEPVGAGAGARRGAPRSGAIPFRAASRRARA